MLERVRATVCIWQYETKGRICAIRGTIVVVSIFMENLWSLVSPKINEYQAEALCNFLSVSESGF